LPYYDTLPEAKISGVDKGAYLEPDLALFVKFQEAYPEFKTQFTYA